MLSFFKELSLSRKAWLFLAFTCLALEGTALYFQHGMGLIPCVMCIYERLALLAILVAGLVGTIAPSFLLFRWVAIAIGLFGSIKGLMLAIRHTDYQLNPAPWNQCEFKPDFPSTLPLDQWFPNLFAAGPVQCSQSQWEFLGWGMPQWLIVVFAIYTIAMALLAISQFKRSQKRVGSRQIFR